MTDSSDDSLRGWLEHARTLCITHCSTDIQFQDQSFRLTVLTDISSFRWRVTKRYDICRSTTQHNSTTARQHNTTAHNNTLFWKWSAESSRSRSRATDEPHPSVDPCSTPKLPVTYDVEVFSAGLACVMSAHYTLRDSGTVVPPPPFPLMKKEERVDEGKRKQRKERGAENCVA